MNIKIRNTNMILKIIKEKSGGKIPTAIQSIIMLVFSLLINVFMPTLTCWVSRKHNTLFNSLKFNTSNTHEFKKFWNTDIHKH